MRHHGLAILTIIIALFANTSYAGGIRGGLRYFGLNMGRGIHARNGCWDCQSYYLPPVRYPATYVDPEAVFMPQMPNETAPQR